MGISRATTHGVAVSLTVVAGMGLGLVPLFLLSTNGYECPVFVSGPGPGAASVEAVRGWWPMGMSCVSEGARSDPDWGLTTLVLIGVFSALCAIPFWWMLAKNRKRDRMRPASRVATRTAR